MMTLLLVLVWVLLTSFALWVVIRHTKNSLGTFILIPFLLFTACSSWYIIESTKGYATHTNPAKNTILLYGAVQKPLIYLLVHDGKEPRLHSIEWTNERESDLANALQSKKEGKQVGVKIDENGGVQLYSFDLPPPPEKKNDY